MKRFEDLKFDEIRFNEGMNVNGEQVIKVTYFDGTYDNIPFDADQLKTLDKIKENNRIRRNIMNEVNKLKEASMGDKQEVVSVPGTEKTYDYDRETPSRLSSKEAAERKVNMEAEYQKAQIDEKAAKAKADIDAAAAKAKENVGTEKVEKNNSAFGKYLGYALVGGAVLGGILAVGKACSMMNADEYKPVTETAIEQDAEETITPTDDMINQYMSYEEVIDYAQRADADLENVLSQNGRNVTIDDEASLAWVVDTNDKNIAPDVLARLQAENALPDSGQDMVVAALPFYDNAGHEDEAYMNNLADYRFEYATYVYDPDSKELVASFDDLIEEARQLIIAEEKGELTEAQVARIRTIYDMFMGWLKSQGTSEYGNRNTFNEGAAKQVDFAGRDVIQALARLRYNGKPIINQEEIQAIVGITRDPATGAMIPNTMVNDWSQLMKDFDDCFAEIKASRSL